MPEILGEALEFEMGNAAVIVNVKGDVKSVNGKTGDVKLKLSDIPNDTEIVTVPTFADLFETTAEEVTVLKDDSYFGSGGTVTFMVARNLASGEKQTVDGGYVTDFYPFLKRKNGDYMVPKPRSGSVGSPVPAQQIADVIGSYFDHGEIKYGGSNTTFAVDYDAEDTPSTDCSSFASMILFGLLYDRSKYAGNAENVFGEYAGMTLPRNPQTKIGGDTGRMCYNAAEMAMYYAQQNRLFYIDYEREHPAAQLQTGDVLFFSHDFVYTSEGGANVDYGRRYLNIDHVGIVLAVYPESNTVLLANAGLPLSPRYTQQIKIENDAPAHNDINISAAQIYDFDTDAKQGAVVYARPIYPDLAQKPTQIVERCVFGKNVTSPTTDSRHKILLRLFFSRPIRPDRVYTLVVDGTMPNDPAQNDLLVLRFATSGGSEYIDYRITNLIKFGDKLSYVFVPPEDIADRPNVYVSALLPSEAEGVDANTYNITKVSLYEGIAVDAPALIERVDNPITFTSVFNTESSSGFACEAWCDGENLHIHVATPLKTAGSEGEVTIGTISSNHFPKLGVQNNLYCSVNAEEMRPLTISAGGVIKTMRKSTDEVGDLFQFDLTL